MRRTPAAASASSAGYSRGDADAAALLRARLGEVAETAPGSIIANLVNFACVAAVAQLYAIVVWETLALAGLLLLALLGWRLHAVRRLPAEVDAEPQLADDDPLGPLKTIDWHVAASATALGAFWGGVALVLLATGGPDVLLFAGIIGTGMMSAGAITYRSAPVAALGWVAGSGLLSGIGLWLAGTTASWIALGLLACFVFVLKDTILTNGRRFERSFLQRCELARSSETIQLLLNDVTEQGSDWLVEVDRHGRIVDPCARLAEETGRPVGQLAGLSFGELLCPGPARAELKEQFLSGRVIRRQLVSLKVGGETRWWLVSARPVRDRHVAFRGVITDITAQRHAEERVSYLAHFDGLTDLPNRFLFNEKLGHLLGDRGEAVAVMYIDLDQFKAINDTLGHPVGDRLLQAVARRLEALVGPGAMVARLGGDEFAVLVPGSGGAALDELADRIVHQLGQPLSLGDHEVMVGASIGIALAPGDADTPEALMRMADLALYAAKAAGRGTARRFVPAMDEAAQGRRQTELDLRAALAAQQFRLHFQPLIDTDSGSLAGCEALIRWDHPDRGIVMPDEFIAIAEDTGLIVQIGEWAIRQALDDARHLPPDIEVAINLSPLQMRSPTLIPTILGSLAASGIAPQRLCLEITESVLMHDSTANVETLHKLRGFGIQIGLDDFGTGYSSLNYLRSFPFSKIKIDRCFVADVDHRPQSRAIIASVVELATMLGMKTVAEGVERESQVAALRASGCRYVQGFLYSEALPLDRLVALQPAARRRA